MREEVSLLVRIKKQTKKESGNRFPFLSVFLPDLGKMLTESFRKTGFLASR